MSELARKLWCFPSELGVQAVGSRFLVEDTIKYTDKYKNDLFSLPPSATLLCLWYFQREIIP